jgi:hypothetical protein
MAAAVARRPSSRVTEVFDQTAEREGAYRMLSNAAVAREALTEAMCEATACRCAVHDRVYVAIDGSSLSLRDPRDIRGLGGVGAWKNFGRGLHVATALALDPQGVAIGVCAQTWWARTERSPQRRPSRRKLADKETRFARNTLDDATHRLHELAPDTHVITIMDRGFDCWPVLQTAEQDARFIVRARLNRRLLDESRGGRRYLVPTLESQPVRGRYAVDVPAQPGRPARRATLQVQTARVCLELRVSKQERQYVHLHAVLAREVGGPRGASLSWMLLTTESTETFEKAVQIIQAYTLRWRIEEMHRMWKRGGGDVEQTQLRSRQAIEKWATLHCAVAARALHLTQLARTHPERPAIEEFTPDEIDAAIVLRAKRTPFQLGDRPSLGQIVRLIADIGGYTGKSSGGPPGPTVIGRGLERVELAADIVRALRPSKKPRKVTNG